MRVPSPSVSAAWPGIRDEADAIVACCWRYGSYAHVLTAGELYPEFRANSRLSRVSDYEMKRINLEFSSGLAAWWSDRASDPGKIHRRVRGALRLLPMPWRARHSGSWDEVLGSGAERFIRGLQDCMAAHPEEAYRYTRIATVRQEANYAVNHAYRCGFIEDLYTGTWSRGTEVPGFLRFYTQDVIRICRETARNLSLHLAARELDASQVFRRVLLNPFLFSYPSGWSEAEETASVEYSGLPGAGPLEPRLRWLAQRYPVVYSLRNNAACASEDS
jgi:hypothetical protein